MSTIHNKMDLLQHRLGKLPQIEMPLDHVFTPGLYTRTIHMPKGAIVMSRIHKFEHPFIISKGSVTVIDEHGNRTLYKAPYVGVTKPGTRRTLLIHEDCVWTTCHTGDWTPDTDPEEIVKQVTDTPDVSYLSDVEKKEEIPA